MDGGAVYRWECVMDGKISAGSLEVGRACG